MLTMITVCRARMDIVLTLPTSIMIYMAIKVGSLWHACLVVADFYSVNDYQPSVTDLIVLFCDYSPQFGILPLQYGKIPNWVHNRKIKQMRSIMLPCLRELENICNDNIILPFSALLFFWYLVDWFGSARDSKNLTAEKSPDILKPPFRCQFTRFATKYTLQEVSVGCG